jgi:hypothetical protein
MSVIKDNKRWYKTYVPHTDSFLKVNKMRDYLLSLSLRVSISSWALCSTLLYKNTKVNFKVNSRKNKFYSG